MSERPEIDETLPDAFEGERLDRVVSTLDGCSRSKASQLISDGDVRVDGRAVTTRSFRVAGGMRVQFPPTETEDIRAVAQSEVVFEVLYDDEHIVVVNKPPGLVVHPGAGRPDLTLANGLLHRYPEIDGIGQPERPGIVHRLDGDTSGLLVVARSSEAYDPLVAAMSEHRVERIYAAVVDGSLADDRGTVDAPLGRSTKQRTKMAVVADGRWARTHYEVRERAESGEATLLRCELETGRTHQIRVHLAAIGHHVLGDTLYGPRTGNPDIERVGLHAHRLGLYHPVTSEYLTFEAPIPDDLHHLAAAHGVAF